MYMTRIIIIGIFFILSSCSTVRIDKNNKIVKRNGLYYLKTKNR